MLSGWLWVSGSVMVFDDTGDVVEAVATDDRSEQRLYRLPGGTFYAMPRVEGEIEVRCRDGSKHRAGYVTRHFHTWVRVEVPCGKLIELH